MSDTRIPAPSLTMDHYRAEVGRRARTLALRRRRWTATVSAAVVALVAVTLVSAGAVDQPPPTRTATGSTPARPVAPGSSRSSATAAPASPAPATNGQAIDGAWALPNFAPGSPAPLPVAIDQRPSGSVATVGVDHDVLIILADPRHGWGRAVVTVDGDGVGGDGVGGDVVSVVSQSRAAGKVRIVLRAGRPGRASVTVPYPGRPSASWHGTIVVTPRP